MSFKKKVEEAAHSHFPDGADYPEGFGAKPMYNHKKASFIAGAKWYRDQKKKKQENIENYL